MMSNLLDVVAGFSRRRVLVVGDAILDTYLRGSATRLSREAPVPVVSVMERVDVPGGAANAAANVHSLGGEVRFLSVVGSDEDAQRLRAALEAADVSTDDILEDSSRRTLTKQRLVGDGQMLARFDEGTTQAIDGWVAEELLARLERHQVWADVVILSDYGAGVLSNAVVEGIHRLRRITQPLLVIDAKDPRRFRTLRPTAVKPNYVEACDLLDEPPLADAHRRPQQVAAAAGRLLEACGAQLAAVTLDSDGVLLLERDAPPYRTYARPETNARAAGAGDTFAAALSLALAAGQDGPVGVEIASAAAALAVGKDGTATCRAAELLDHLSAETRAVLGPGDVPRRVASYRRQGRRIVFTNGCFDILHRGHVTYLNRAKALGDVLIVGLNTDDSVRRLKGPDRPINSLEDRAQVLAALSCIDHIVPFADDSPVGLIRAIRPDVYVKGGDYTFDTLPEAPLVAELGGDIQILPLVEDRSTSRIIERIQTRGSTRVPS